MDHRLGPAGRIRDRQHRRRDLVERIFHGLLEANGIHIPLHFTMDLPVGACVASTRVQDAIASGATLDALKAGCDAKDAVDHLRRSSTHIRPGRRPRSRRHADHSDLPALAIVFIITALVYIGIRESKIASNIMVGLKLAVILLVIIVGAFFVKTANWHPVPAAWFWRRDDGRRGRILCVHRL